MSTHNNKDVNKINYKTPLNEEQDKKLRKEFSDKLSARLREVRTDKGMTQQEVSEKAGLHLTYVGHLELGKYYPTVYVVWKIANALGVTVGDLIDF